MRIKRLTLNNIGSFAGEHSFLFQTDNQQKQIVLPHYLNQSVCVYTGINYTVIGRTARPTQIKLSVLLTIK